MDQLNLPSFALFPPTHLRKLISPTEWDSFLDSWTSLVQAFLSLPVESLIARAGDKSSHLFEFLATLTKEACHRDVNSVFGVKETKLQRLCFLLVRRLITEVKVPWSQLGEPSFIGDLCSLYLGSPILCSLMERLWSDLGLEKSPNMLKNKTKLVQVLVGANGMPSSDLELSLRRLVATVKTCPSYALFLMQGSDFWDALLDAWRSGAGTFRSKIMATIYYSLTSLLQSDNSNLSLLLDHLFDLLADDGKSGQVEQGLLLTDLVCATPFLRKFRSRFDAALSTGRSKSMLQSLESVRATSMQGNLQSNRRRIHQQKGKKPSPHQPDVQKMSLVTEVRDLFPDLSASTVIELLDRFGDDVEKVVAHLLDNQPVSNADNVAESNINLHSVPDTPDLAVTSTSSSQRRNYFDRDELDKLEVAASRLHIGHKETTWEPSSSQNKAAIFSALAAFDSDSDERDDTYDIDDVGGAIDNTIGAESEAVSNEDSLYVTWKSSPEVFARDAATRRGKARAMLRNDTGMTDEAIEGWALMLGRDPRRQAKLETRSSSFRGEQAELSATAWRAKGEDTVEDHAGANTQSSDRGNLRGRGRGRGHGSAFRGNAAGPTGEKDTQLARQRKDANKGSRANHNRRNQRAKKLARAGFPG